MNLKIILKSLKIIKLKKPGSVSPNQKKMKEYVKRLKYIVSLIILNQVVIQVKKVKD